MWPFMRFSEILVHQLWMASLHGAIAVIISLIGLRAFQRLPAAFHCWVWRLVCLKMLIALFWWGNLELPWLPASQPHSSIAQPVMGFSAAPRAAAVKVSSLRHTPLEASPTVPSASHHVTPGFAVWLVTFWLIGVSYQVWRAYYGWRKSVQLVRLSAPIREGLLARVLTASAKQLGVAVPEGRSSPNPIGPLVVGAFRPRIIIPEELAKRLTENSARMLLVHELAHIRRRDLAWNWLGVLTGALLFFSPFVWIAQRRWLLAQESACDETAISVVPNSLAEYVDTLLQCSIPERRRDPSFVGAASISAKALRMRIEKMNAPKPSKRMRTVATACLTMACIVGMVPWKLVPATADEASEASPVENRQSVGPGVTVLKTFEIDPSESSLAHDGVRPPVDRFDNRMRFRNQRQLRRTGRLGRNGAQGGFRSNVSGGGQIQGQNATGTGGFASGTLESPNYVVALRLSPLDKPVLVTVAEGTIAIDDAGKEYKPLTQMGLVRTSVPEFEDAHPDCAGAYFRLSKKRRPRAFKEIKGQLRVTPITMHKAEFPLKGLREGAVARTNFGRITVGRFKNTAGWEFEVTTPGPGENRMAVFQFAGMVRMELIDSNDGVHKPRLRRGSGGGFGGAAGAPGVEQITQIVSFEELDEGEKAEKLVVRIRELGEPKVIPFSVQDVKLH